ncbi:VPGUxxT family thioredoxin-like (seleno)protein, type 2 [Portibacter marinus]|uniref:VPGUxxT family thioredoxin-like (seleno)protein, type 2 n=1 Tax=Portibacter marinus TaxID=2898660 RepID=UPI001F3F5C29|nr:VPGUxxT family thioredoxin-like (seleno)protein, type 2 [Portibacter marinus]
MIYLLLSLWSLFQTPVNSNPEELGKVTWHRNYNEVLKLAENLDKPVFILFQEVPGCSTCKNYGNHVLSHPLIVEAIEDEFIPLVIYNNKGGADKSVLEKYNEPTWNNPVVRIVDKNGKNIVRRLYSNYSQQGVVQTMINALLESNKIVPEYLHLLREELEVKQGQLKESYVSMYCFWTGEKIIGNIKGVAETEAGFMDGKEVVRFKYNPDLVNYSTIVSQASNQKCADQVYSNDPDEQRLAYQLTNRKARMLKSYRADKTPKYYLANSIYKHLPMSEYQAQKINVRLGENEDPSDLLSPRQQKLISLIRKNRKKDWKILFNRDFTDAWWTACEHLN